MTKQINQLPAGAAVTGANLFEAEQAAASKKVTAAQVRDYVDNNPVATRPISKGGTGATTAGAAINNLLPAQAGQAGKILGTNGTDPAWVTDAGGVTAVNSPLSTLTVSIAGVTLSADLNLAHPNTWTAEQDYAATVGGTPLSVKLLEAGLGYAVHITAGGAAPTSALFCADGTAASFGNGSNGVAICSGATSLLVLGAPFDCQSAAKFSGQLGFYGTAPVAQQLANLAMIDLTTGSAGTTLNLCGPTNTVDQSIPINDNFASIATRLAEIRALLLTYGLGS